MNNILQILKYRKSCYFKFPLKSFDNFDLESTIKQISSHFEDYIIQAHNISCVIDEEEPYQLVSIIVTGNNLDFLSPIVSYILTQLPKCDYSLIEESYTALLTFSLPNYYSLDKDELIELLPKCYKNELPTNINKSLNYTYPLLDIKNDNLIVNTLTLDLSYINEVYEIVNNYINQ